MKVQRSRLFLSLGLLLGGFVVACGGGAESTGGSDTPAEEAAADGGGGSEVGDATILDVLHSCNHVTFHYEGGQSGATIGEYYWSAKVVWNDRTFTVEDRYVMDEGTDKAVERTIELEATVSEGFDKIEKLVAVIGGKGPKELQTRHEEFTWVDVPISDMYRKVMPNWKDNPGGKFQAYLKRDELDAHVPVWTVTATDSAGVEWSTEREMLLNNHMPFEDSSFLVSVGFRREE